MYNVTVCVWQYEWQCVEIPRRWRHPHQHRHHKVLNQVHNCVMNVWECVWEDLQKSISQTVHITRVWYASSVTTSAPSPLSLHFGSSVSALTGHGHAHGTPAHLSRLTQRRGDDTLRFTLKRLHNARDYYVSLIYMQPIPCPLLAKSLSMYVPSPAKSLNQKAKLKVKRRWSCLRGSKSSFLLKAPGAYLLLLFR